MNLNNYYKVLKTFLSFKSISTDPAFKQEVIKCSNWLHEFFVQNSFKVKFLKSAKLNPIIFAETKFDKNKKTVLIYGHYDVQPEGDVNSWKGKPFELKKDLKKIYGRGVVDNKGQILIHILNVVELLKNNNLKYNVKFFIEGNEETGADLTKVVKQNKELLKSDFALISDGEVVGNNPCIEQTLRGNVNLTINLKTANTPLHSGIYGGALPSASLEICTLLSKIKDSKSKILIKDFYKNAPKPTKQQIQNNKNIPFSEKELYKHTGIKQHFKVNNYDFYTNTGLLPNVEVTSINSGYIGQGYANIVVDKASAKLNIRVFGQSEKQIKTIFNNFVKTNVPNYVDYDIKYDDYVKEVYIDTSKDLYKSAESMLQQVYKKPVVYKNVGGTLPILDVFRTQLKCDLLLIPFANEDCNMHGVNENFNISFIKKAFKFSSKFFSL